MTAPNKIYYKCLTADGTGPYSGVTWPLDGSWIAAVGDLDPCSNGIHVCRREDVIQWLNARIFQVECGGESVTADNKVVFRRARIISEYTTWNERIQRLFAADCAEAVLHIFEAELPDDDRPRKAIAAARAFARGAIDTAALAAARAAAWDAARDATRDATRAAARAAAWATALDAALDAAWATTLDAALDAARAATLDATLAAARAAAGAAAGDAAGDAQTNILFEYLDGVRS